MKYEITHKCGHVSVADLIGKGRDREREISMLSQRECPACRKARQEKESAGMPNLTGTEKQASWALDVRTDFVRAADALAREKINYLESMITKHPDREQEIRDMQTVFSRAVDSAKAKAIQGHTSAHWWIENRDGGARATLAAEVSEIIASYNGDYSTVREKAQAEITPKDRREPGVVEIIVKDDEVMLRYEKDDRFRIIVKELGYQWDSERKAWVRSIGEKTGAAIDRAAEAGNKLLREGFAIRTDNEIVHEKAVSADFEPECVRWVGFVLSGECAGSLALSFPRGDRELYLLTKQIRGAMWVKPNIVVQMEYHNEVEDLAEHMGFRLTQKAKEAIDQYEAAKLPPVTPSEPVEPEYNDSLGEILKSPDEILPDLRDD